MQIKTRFSPSPTGELHAGGARTALYNWLFACSKKGKFILRIEDTDLKRSKKIYINNIIDSLKWLNIKWDEGPYFQTDRYELYLKVINNMLKLGTAYKCYCSKERLQELRKKQLLNNEKPKYDRFCLKQNNINNKDIYVVRFFNNFSGYTSFKDQIRGLINFNNNELDDLIILRSDGIPTYNFCSVIDDWDMKITHVIRGEEHINNTPRQINILKSLNANIPIYSHISTILDDSGKKLSKRYNSTSIMKYREDGYLPEAIINHLIRLGWSNNDQEIFDINEAKKKFSINNINKSSCFFNIKKLQWLNSFYIKKISDYDLLKHIKWFLNKEKININNGPPLLKVLTLLKTRYFTLKEIINSCRYFYEDIKFDDFILKHYCNKKTIQILQEIYKKMNNINEWNQINIKNVINNTISELKLNKSDIFIPIRLSITGYIKSPELTIILSMLKKNIILKRIDNAIKYIYKLYKSN